MNLWFVIIGVLIYLLLGGNFDLKLLQKKGSNSHLDERLAKGEISIEEYRTIKTTLKENK